MEEKKYEYIYPVEELDKIIEQMDQGIIPMMNDQMQLEVKMRYKELQSELFDDDDEDDIDVETRKKHREMVNKRIEENKRKASRDDVYIMKISDEMKAKIREEMSESIVRPNPNDAYNKRDEDLYNDNERRVIYQRLAGLRNCYYNQQDYVNAINILKDAIEYSLSHDYPWLTKEEAIQEFNAGRIKFKYCNTPVLYVNSNTQVTDPEILKGIVSGEITLKDRRDDVDASRRNRNRKYTPVSVDYDVISDASYEAMVAAHKQGYDTPMSVAIKHKATTYNRYAIPVGSRFAQQKLDKDGQPLLFDWSRENAGEEYFNLVKGKKSNASEIVGFLNSENSNNLNNVFAHNINDFLRSMRQDSQQTGGYDYIMPNRTEQIQYNAQAAQIEQALLASIKATNNNMNR